MSAELQALARGIVEKLPHLWDASCGSDEDLVAWLLDPDGTQTLLEEFADLGPEARLRGLASGLGVTP